MKLKALVELITLSLSTISIIVWGLTDDIKYVGVSLFIISTYGIIKELKNIK